MMGCLTKVILSPGFEIPNQEKLNTCFSVVLDLNAKIGTGRNQQQVKVDLHFQQWKVKFLFKISVLPKKRVGFGLDYTV